MKKFYSIFFLAFFVLSQSGIARTTSCSAQFGIQISNNIVYFASQNSTDSSFTHIWYFGDGTSSNLANPVHTFGTCGTYTVYHEVRQHNPNGLLMCQDSVFQTVVIACNTPCNLVASFNALMVNNQPNVFEFVNTSVSTPGTVVYSLWNFGDGSTMATQGINNQTHTYATAGIYNVCLIVTNGTTSGSCRDTFCLTIQVQVPNPNPCNIHPSFSAQTTPTQSNVYLFSNTTAPSSAAMLTTWNFGDSTTGTGTQATHTYNQSGTYNVCMHAVVSNTCSVDTCFTITVTVPTPTPCNVHAGFTTSYSNNQLNVVQCTNTSTTGTAAAVYSIWSFGDGSGATTTGLSSQTHTYTTSGLYTICLKVITGQASGSVNCADSICHTIQVQVPAPACNLVANFTTTATSSPNVISFVNGSTGFAAGDSIRWTFGDGTVSYDLNPTHSFTNAGTYTVCLRISRYITGAPPCISEVCHQVTVSGTTPCNIIPTFSIQTSQSNVFWFVNTTAPSSANMLTTWSFGDSTTGTGNQVTHTYNHAGTYLVCMHVVVSNTCMADTCYTITVTMPNPNPCNVHASYSTTNVNNQSNVIEFVNTSTTGTTTPTGVYSVWSFGDGTPVVNAPGVGNQTHTYAQSGTYTVCLKVLVAQSGSTIVCADSICHTIQVQVPTPTPCNLNPAFTVTTNPNDSSLFIFTNTTITNNAPIVNWSFGDSAFATGNIVTHIFNQPGVYNVCMHVIVSNTCSADTCITITVNGNPNPQPCNVQAGFAWQCAPTNSTTASNAVYFLNTSFGYAPGDSITWTFGDGTSSNLLNPVHTYSGQGPYNVCLRIVHMQNIPGAPPCVSEICHAVTLPPTLIAYPNPVTNVVNVNVTLNTSGPIYGFIFNSQNILVSQQIFSGATGNNTVSFNTSNLPSGYYTIRLYYDGHFSVARFVKL